MFYIKLNRQEYSYDVHSLVKAFFPEETVKVLLYETEPSEDESVVSEEALAIRIQIDANEDAFFTSYVQMMEHGAKQILAKPVFESKYQAIESDQNPASTRKQDFSRFLYRCLCEVTGKELPWGNLTGIRPTKIVMGLLEQGKSRDEIYAAMKESHMVSEEKIALSIDIAGRERELLARLHGTDGYSLYIGIPFCPTTCLYCSFTSYPIAAHRDRVETYIDCLIKEMHLTSELMRDKVLDTVYIGGGTPTTLEPDQLARIIDSLKEIFDFSTVQEFTVEAGRADSITEEKLKVLYEKGVSRISVNPQTMNEETLKFIGRRASAAATVEAYRLARKVGFDNINMDIILGLPGETDVDVTETIKKIGKLSPDSLTVHSLAVKRASKLRQFIEEHGVEILHNGDVTMEIAAKGAKEMGMHPYYLYRQKNMTGNLENVGFAKDGKYGIYNILIMEEIQSIVALGAGSISKNVLPGGRIERCDNVKDVELYIDQIEEMLERKRQLYRTGE
ncbi:MAG: coproporphyrinogen dehydrogenase HemZ [Lachnospiraceae bacterium]|nr:coproporphyrinogen dehydrogenase HemZ [Lachnospiraceae bacterium]